MQKNTAIWLGVGALVIYSAYNHIKNNAWDILRNYIHIAGFRLVSIYKESINTQILLEVKNPLPKTLFCDGFLVDVYFNGVPISKISQPVNQYLYANAVTNIILNVSISQKQLGDSVWNHIMSGGTVRNWKIDIRGLIRVEGIDIDFETFLVMDDLETALNIGSVGEIKDEKQAVQFAKRVQKKSETVPYSKMTDSEQNMMYSLNRSGNIPELAARNYISRFTYS